MGIGDQLLATGFAKGAHARGKLVAFGDGEKQVWDQNSAEIFRGNPNICPPGRERVEDVEWVAFYRGNRVYNKSGGDRWIWNYEFRPKPGEVFFTEEELRFGQRMAGCNFILVEPNVPIWKPCAPNKQWPVANYEAVTDKLVQDGHIVIQLHYPRMGPNKMKRASILHSPSFRAGMSILSQASLYIGAEGGMHHAAAAVGVPGVVLFGGFVPPQVLGYDTHTNLTGNSQEACGMFNKCQHCIDAMASIEVDEVLEAAQAHLRKEAA